MICAKSASLQYSDHGKEVFACRAVDLVIGSGEFLGILGPSGSGKSSLLYLLSGLKTPTQGEVSFQGQNMSKLPEDQRSRLRLKEFGFVFQQPYLLGYLTALENVLLAVPGQPQKEEASDLLTKLDLQDKSHRLPHELSGGERQRVCVARALLGSPKVIFADEPTAALDHRNGLQVVNLLDENRGEGSLVMVTHDPSMLEQADRVVHLSDGTIQVE
ncbi:MAG: ABC transporter ATP-binding protein [Chlorobia bacterium]|nr:ABC transporter ATP-binding protein [Fimbriimonadaceae bacterium]